MKRNVVVLSMFLVLAMSVLESSAFANPAPPSLSDVTSTTMVIGGRNYHEVQATLNGTGSGGAYRVPVEFLYPVNPSECNGTGIVDLLNNSAMVLAAPIGGAVRPLATARARLKDKFIGEKGYSYVSVQWEKDRNAITTFNQLFGTNYVIPTLDDQFAIILDAGSLLKSPPAGLPGSPCAVDKAVAYGFSASTGPIVQLKFQSHPLAAAFAATFDASLIDSTTSGFGTVTMPKDGGLTIVISSETDVVLFRNDLTMRGQTSTYRQYEIPGSSHVTTDQHDLDDIVAGLPFAPTPPVRHSLAKNSPVHRAMMEHLRRWMNDGTPPPPSVTLDGSNYPLTPLPCVGLPIPGIATIPRDADGNALGGVRLPYLARPLGHYNGIELQYGCSAGGFPQVAIVAGTFIRDDAMINRYKNHGEYVSGVSKAADFAFQQGWILDADRQAYKDQAGQCPVGRIPTEELTLDDMKFCHDLD